MSRDEHDGNTKCQCCAQAKRQYEEILREIETRFVRSAKIIEEMGAASHKRKTPAHRTGHRRRERKVQVADWTLDMENRI